MLRKASAINGYAVAASDGRLGTVSDFLFDDASWMVRWLVVDTGNWLSGRRVLLPPSVLGHLDPTERQQTLATLIAVYGLLMTPLGWGWALCVWGYAVARFLVTDPVKLLAYRILDPVKAGLKPAAETRIPSNLTPKIAKRAYELSKQKRLERRAVQDRPQAERRI